MKGCCFHEFLWIIDVCVRPSDMWEFQVGSVGSRPSGQRRV